MNKKAVWITSIVIATFFITTLLALEYEGRKSRTYKTVFQISETGLPVHVVRNARDMYSLYKSEGLHGRVLVHMGKFLQSVPIDSDDVLGRTDRFPIKLPDAIENYKERISYKNILWVAMQDNIFREIYFVLPRPIFDMKFQAVSEKDPEVSSVNSDTIVTHDWGSRKVISSRLPTYHEPIVLNIDASFFDIMSPPDVIGELKKSGIRVDVVTLNLSEDNPDVMDAGRENLKKFAIELSGGNILGSF